MWRFSAGLGPAAVASLVATSLIAMPSAAADSATPGYSFTCNRDSLTADFAHRDALPQSRPDTVLSARSDALNGGWGPAAAALPPVDVPADAGCDAVTWRRERIVAAALRYRNEPGNPHALQYRHHHIPGWDPAVSTMPAGAVTDGGGDGDAAAWAPGRGLDCSNFTAWVYNYALGIGFSGNVTKQYAGTAGPMGLPLPAGGPFQTGDLVFLHPGDDTERASHVAIVVDDDHVIDSRFNAPGVDGVRLRERDGWYRTAVLGGWRPIV